MIKVKTLKELRYKGAGVKAGTVMEIENNVAQIWVKNNFAKNVVEEAETVELEMPAKKPPAKRNTKKAAE
nr:MAG TPA: hypothetical protein [Caudoviricetes sp.]DAJ57290.1 MAG TPA: hypothetical protein [Caudoviricetes sp.]